MNMWPKLPRVTAAALTLAVAANLLSGTGIAPEAQAAAAQEGPRDPLEVEQFTDRFFEQPEIKESLAGAALVVVKDDKVLVKKGYGYADVDKKLPVDPDRTVFRIASISKVIAATAIMQLAEEEKLDLNLDLSNYMGQVQIRNDTGTPLTMRNLLTNSTGFDYGDMAELSTGDLTREVSIKQYVRDNVPTVIRKPGEYYRYDNFGFTLQGYVLEQVTGQPFGEYVQEHIFNPLRMTNSSFRLTQEILGKLAVPYNQLGEAMPDYAMVPTELPSGGMLSTGSDMAHFMLAQLNGGTWENHRILKKETTAEMLKPQLSIHPKLPNMAYGFEYAAQQNYNGYQVVEKGGDLEGYHSGMWLLPDERVGVFLTVNKDIEIRQPFLEAFMNHYFPKKQAPETQHNSPQQPDLERFTGMYSDLRNRMWTTRIEAEDGKLIVKDPLGTHTLQEIEPLLFQDELGAKAAFKLNEQGEVQAYYYDMKSDSWAEKMPEPLPYPDVPEDHAYAPYIKHLRQLKVLDDGKSNSSFQPEEALTREQFIGWFIRWAGIAPSRQTPVFSDVGASAYVKEIQAAYEFGLIQGDDNNRFHPQRLLTRQEAAAIIWRMAFRYLHAGPEEALLAGETDSWAEEGVRFVVGRKLHGPETATGENGRFDYGSRKPMLKQEAAALLSLFADRLF
jgi:CubicO group peptidase (beta-lactamase class C family)